MPSAALKNQPETSTSSGGRLVSIDGRALPLTQASVSADARGGLVRVTLEQTFRNPHQEALRVTYSLPLPADGAVSGFSFRLGEERIVGEIDTRRQARQRFEDAILDGRTAAILDQERSSVFTQEVGNLPPLTEVVCQVQIDQKLAFLPDGCWEWRFPTVVAPRYLGAAGRVADAARVSVEVAQEALPVKLGLSLSIRDVLTEGTHPESGSHALHSARGLGRTDVTFADERGAGLDRDVVVRWKVGQQTPGTSLDVYEKNGRLFGLLTLTPPRVEVKMEALPRDLIVLLDTSGSMSGSPIDQSKKLASALVDSLRDEDQLELIEFSMNARRWKKGPVAATAANRRDAQSWLSRLQASGGTEMRAGILEALAPLRPDAQRQIILVTDGLIGFEREIVQTIAHQLPRGSRVHTIGVGSGVNRSLTAPVARAGRGLELVMGLGEDVEVAAARLLARTNQPLIANVEISGTAVKAVAPARVADLYAGAPALISVELDPRGGTLTVSGELAHGRMEETLRVSPQERTGTASVATLFAREQVEDLELAAAAGAMQTEIDAQIERVGLELQISTRLTSWIAVSAAQTVDPRAPRRSETMPQALPFGLSAEGVGLRSAAAPMASPVVAELVTSSVRQSVALSRSAPKRMREAAPEQAGALGKAAPVMEDAEREAPQGSMRRSEAAPEPDAAEEARAGAPAPEAPSPMQREKKLKTGLADLAKDLFGAITGKGAPPPPPAAAAPARQGAPSPAQRTLRGQVVRVTAKETTVEVVLDGEGLNWALPLEAQVELEGGGFATVRIVAAKSTAPGTYGAGLQLTVVLEGALEGARIVRFLSGAVSLEIVIDPAGR